MPEETPIEIKLPTLKRIFREDLEAYGKYFFPNHLKLKTPKFHREIFDMYEGDDKFIAVAAPRGHAKSTITDLVFLSHEIIHNKCKFVLLISDTYTQAVMFLDSLKSEFEANEKLRSFYGDMTSSNWSEGEIIVNGVMVKAIGAGMKVRGLKFGADRPDLIITDDLENDELVESKERREKLERWLNGAVIPSMAKGGRLILIGTILHYDSLLSKIVINGLYPEFKTKIYKAINDFGALWPEHLNLSELEDIKNNYINKGQSALFYQEYQNDPISDENRKFKIEKFKYYEREKLIELDNQLTSTFITIDRAYSTEKTADFTAIIVNRIDKDNNWHILQAERFKGTEKELIDKIFDLKGYYNPVKIGIEQKAFKYTIEIALKDEMRRRNSFFLVEELKDGGNSKTKRIEGLVPRFEAGTIYLDRSMYDLIDELIKFPKGIHDDLIDALAYQLYIASSPKAVRDIKQTLPSGLCRNLRSNVTFERL